MAEGPFLEALALVFWMGPMNSTWAMRRFPNQSEALLVFAQQYRKRQGKPMT